MAHKVIEVDSKRTLAAFHRRKEAEAEVEHLVEHHDYDEDELRIEEFSEDQDQPPLAVGQESEEEPST